MKHIIIYIFSINLLHQVYGQDQPLQSFALNEVNLLESPFYQAQQTDLEYILELNPDRLLAPFLIDAGLPTKAPRYGNWENTGLDGHIGGHYLSALSLMYASTSNPEVLERLNYMLDELQACQTKNGNGYVGGVPEGQEMWEDLSQGQVDAHAFSLNGKWVPLYNIHKLFAGLRDAYLIAGVDQAREMLVALSDWLVDLTSGLNNQQIQLMLRSEHGGMNEVLADVAAITGESKYLDLAEKFSHQEILTPLTQNRDQLTGLHANTQIPKVIGFKRISELNDNTSWAHAAEFFWNTVIENRTVSIGGNSVREHFHPVNDFFPMIESVEGPETCNTYNMLRLTKMLFLSNPEARYMDYYERALYNHILSSQHPDGGFVYMTPMRPRHYRTYSQVHQGFWCCVGSGIENHGKYGEMIYSYGEADLYVNLFIPSELTWEEKDLTLTQTTAFPFTENSTLQFTVTNPTTFSLHLRHPEWLSDTFRVFVNGEQLATSSLPSSYVTIDRSWQNGDMVTFDLPMKTRLEYLPDQSQWASFIHGPIVLAAVTDSAGLSGLWANESRFGHIAGGTQYGLSGAPGLLLGEDFLKDVVPIAGEPLTFSISGLVDQDQYTDLRLVPFFRVHEARYVIYWPVKAKALGVDDQQDHPVIRAWPNPSYSGQMNLAVELPTGLTAGHLTIYDLSGKPVMEMVVSHAEQTISLSLPSGIYLVNMNENDIHKKLIFR